MTKAVVISAHELRIMLVAALRVLRHHYFTFITAAVLTGVLVITATSSSFSDRGQTSSSGAGTGSIWPKRAPGFTPHGRAMIYYIVESNEQANAMECALRSDVTYSEMNGARQDFGRVIYLNPRTPMEEANVAALLNDVVASSPHGGYIVTIIDLRN